MDNTCSEMPHLITIDEFNQDWNSYLKHLYTLYLEEFFYNTVFYKGLPIKTFTNLDYNGKQETFNHITTKGSKDRVYNTMRCERYKWIKAMIEGTTCNNCYDLAIWEEVKKKKKRTLIWCRKTNFVIVLEKRKNEYYLITAYCVIYSNKKGDLMDSYNKYNAKNRSRLSF
jgi:hypothetical protein